MKPCSQFAAPTGRLIPASTLLYAQLAFEPKKSFICNKIRPVVDPNEPKVNKRIDWLRSVIPDRIGVPASTGPKF
jgi:hypothetical protein